MKNGRGNVIQIREPQILYFGKNHREKYSTTLEFPGKERVDTAFSGDYAGGLLCKAAGGTRDDSFSRHFYFIVSESWKGSNRKKERIWKEFICHDIVEALDRSFKKGSLTAFDVQRMKQLCRHMAWKMLVREKWMQELENQEEMLASLEADVKFLERVHEMDMNKKEQQSRYSSMCSSP